MTKKQDIPDIALRIKQLRYLKNWSQSDLAEQAGVTLGAVGNWETGKRFPAGKNLTNLAHALGVSESDILQKFQPLTESAVKLEPVPVVDLKQEQLIDGLKAALAALLVEKKEAPSLELTEVQQELVALVARLNDREARLLTEIVSNIFNEKSKIRVTDRRKIGP